MPRFKVVSKVQFDEFGRNKVIKVDAIDPKIHLHASSFTAYNFSLTDNGVRGEVPFTEKVLKSIQEQYGEDAVVSESKVKDESEAPKKKKGE